MHYTRHFDPSLVSWLGILTSCANTHTDPFIYTNLVGQIVGVNTNFLNWSGISTVEDIPSIEQWLQTQGIEPSMIFTHSGEYKGTITFGSHEYPLTIRSEVIALDNEFVTGISFRDISILERAKVSERYFDKFKMKLLTSVSHEFRTPMNAIVGFIDLLSSSPLSSWQQEYVDLVGKSAHSMMRNIENLLELMQVESGDIKAHMGLFKPFDLFESFSTQFQEQIESKELQWNVLIDPRLPLEMIGDQDKIVAILRNLVQNAIKFTPNGGQVLLEIIVVKKNHTTIEVEYAISDTGIGIDRERMKTLLRPFSSAWENQRQGKDGMGVGLSLSHKYIDMMDSHLMLASEVNRGSRFSFRLTHTVNQATYLEPIVGKKIAFYTHEPHSAQSVLLEKYFELLMLNVNVIRTLMNSDLEVTDVLIIDVPHLSSSQVETITSMYPHLQIIGIIEYEYQDKAKFLRPMLKALISPPFFPSTLHKALFEVEKTTRSTDDAHNHHTVNTAPVITRNANILIAEDNPINLRLIETILTQNSYRVKGTENGQKAVDAYLKEHFDLVLMDIDMPVMDGLTANRLIKEIDKRDGRGFVPVIALTAHALIGDRERIINAGLDAHLAKPIDKMFLLRTIERYLTLASDKEKAITV